jgi:hypothetical protein
MRAWLIQLGGWALLILYLAQTPIVFDPIWVGVYVAVSVGIGAIYVLAIKPLVRLMSGTAATEADAPREQQELFPHPKNAPLVEDFFRRPLRTVILAPGETGLFFVPVAIIGVTWWSALLAALLFGLAHHRTYSVEQCSVKAVTAFLNCYFILPYGVIHLAIGHLIVDALGIGVFWLTTLNEDRLSANSTVETDARKSGARGSP